MPVKILRQIFYLILRPLFPFLIPVILIFGLFKMLSISGIRPLIVLSGSMEPVIHTGSVIFVDTKRKDARPGDIITVDISFEGDGSVLVTHRLVREENGTLITKGDANKSEDFFNISRRRIIGIYAFQIPFAGYIIACLRQLLPREKNKS